MDERRLVLLRRALLDWGAQARRELPWRTTRDPWAVLVSECMSAQTQVARVAPVWEAFVRRFPTAAACAAADPAEVLRAWAGLGYNARAVRLHAAAVRITELHAGVVPASLDELLALPGVGPYTARAVLAFAFGRDVGVVDTNAARVLARAVAGVSLDAREVQEAADAGVAQGSGWEWNQTVLDLGALVCTARAPRCAACPIAAVCAWRRGGRSTPDPAAGTAGTGRRQSRFEGSDRQGRGRLVAALRAGPVDDADLAAVMGWADDPARARRVASGLVDEAMVRRDEVGGRRMWWLGAAPLAPAGSVRAFGPAESAPTASPRRSRR